MKRFVVVLLLILSVTEQSLSQEIIWQRTIGGSLSDNLKSVIPTLDGGYALSGTSSSPVSGEKNESSNGDDDFWIVKLDSIGNIQWQNSIGGVIDDRTPVIRQNPDGSYIVGGSSMSGISGDKTEQAIGGFDYWVLKLDGSGNIIWQNTIGGSQTDMLTDIKRTSDGGYIIAGYSNSSISGDKTENSPGNFDFWIVKLDGSGNIQWQNTIGGTGGDWAYSVDECDDGNFIIGGHSYSPVGFDKTEPSRGGMDYWVVKIDVNGNKLWDRTFGGVFAEQLNSTFQTADGGFILAGTSFSGISFDKTVPNSGGQDIWIIKLDTNGDPVWQQGYGGTDDDVATVIHEKDDKFFIGGYSYSGIGGQKTELGQGLADYWIICTNSAGYILWQNNIGGSSSDLFTDLNLTPDGNLIAGGYSSSPVSGDKTEVSRGSTDYWIIKLTERFNLATGVVYADLNLNNTRDPSEPAIAHHKIEDNPSGRQIFSLNNGLYNMTYFQPGNSSLSADAINYFTSNPANHLVSLATMPLIDSLNHFAFQPNGVINDLCLTITPTTAFRPGFNAGYVISYENVGTTVINNASVVFYPDNNISFVSSSVTPSNIFPDSIIWNIGALTPFQSGNIVVTVSVNVGVAIGTVINSGAVIYPVAGDANPNCNTHYWEVFVTGSFDPNDILVDRDTLYNYEISNPPYLEYIIRFQNTGNDTAFTVKILNPLDTTKLQLNSLEFVASSHPVDMLFVYHERNMEFLFSNILLPDSNVNEPMSHGFVRYRIKPKTTLAVGDIIGNNAYIYFDFNDPIATNTAITKVVLPTGVATAVAVVEWNVYPNPASGDVKVSFTLKQDAVVKSELFNTTGQLVFSEQSNYAYGSHEIRLPVADLPKGVYYIRLSVNGNVMVKKVVKL